MVCSALVVAFFGQVAASPPLVSSSQWREACKRRHNSHPNVKSLAQIKGENPGAGVEGYDDIEPYVKVYKDGFFKLDCVKDSMFEHGDKFGDNRHGYRMGDIANTSIVRYTEKVPKEDREKMTYSVCFEFCRGIEHMQFFGIYNGRDCYCTPYFEPMASSSDPCDSMCPGDPSVPCGGKGKSQIFSMHMCEDTDEEVKAIQKAAKEIKGKLDDLSTMMVKHSKKAEEDANMMQKSFGQAGDPDISAMFQEAKIWAGKNLDAGKDGEDVVKNLKEAEDKLKDAFDGKDLSKYDNLKKVEDCMRKLKKATRKAKNIFHENSIMWNVTQPPAGRDAKKDLGKTYYNIMYFVDKKYENVSTTCSGELVAEPTLNYSPDECAAACDSLVGECVGFAYFKNKAGVCFLYSKFKTAQYYTDCGELKKEKEDLLQTKQVQKIDVRVLAKARKAPFKAQCVAKLSLFGGTSLKPNIKCPTDNCLKELTKANRCFEKP